MTSGDDSVSSLDSHTSGLDDERHDFSSRGSTPHDVGIPADLADPPVTATPSTKRTKAYRKTRRLAGHYSSKYCDLLNEDTVAAAAPFETLPFVKFDRSQVGGSQWSPQEKNIFFEAIARYGRDDLPAIADAVGTKSTLEIRAYLLLLREGLVQQSLNAEEHRLRSWVDVPAAVEVSRPVELKLDLAAEALAFKQWKREAKQEESLWATTWCITYDLAAELDALVPQEARGRKRSREDDTDQPDGSIKRPKSEVEDNPAVFQGDAELEQTVNLFHSRAWVSLQHNIFMNAGGDRADENWLSIATDEEEPSIIRTAYTDFYRLARALTQRLVQASLFQAMIRLRATEREDTAGRAHGVEHNDVVAALETLNMPPNAREFWAYAPQRSGVQIVDDGELTQPGRVLDYDVVEASLLGLRQAEQYRHESDSDMELLTTADVKQTAEDEELEEYAERLDAIASRREESHLMQMLEQSYEDERDLPEPERPNIVRKTQADLVDWRDWVNYRAVWDQG